MEFFELVEDNVEFIKWYYKFYKNNKFTDKYYENIREFLKKNIFEFNETKEYISCINDIGVIHSSDLLTYYYISRLFYSIEDIYKKKGGNDKLKNEMIDIYFNLINFLLKTNIFSPNDDIDQKDIGNGIYLNKNKKFRENLAKEILIKYLERCETSKFFNFLKTYYNLKEIEIIIQKRIKRWNDIGKNVEIAEIKNKLLGYYKNKTIISNDGCLKKLCRDKTPPFLLKNVGLATEMFVYIYLITQNYGYIVPLLLHQRLYSNIEEILSKKINEEEAIKEKYVMIPTDFLLLSKGKTYALELGRGKTELISTLASIAAIPTIYIDATLNVGHKFGYKCNYCFNSFDVCNKYIENFKIGKTKEKLDCKECEYSDECKSKVYEYKLCKDKKIIKHIHVSCYNDMKKKYKDALIINEEKGAMPTYPAVTGLEKLSLGL